MFTQFKNLNNLSLEFLGGPILAEIGKIKIGAKGRVVESKKGKTFRLPEKFDHFVITMNLKDPSTDTYIPDEPLMKRIAEETNQDPASLKLIPVTLLFDDPNLNFMVRFSCYKNAQQWCVGDGEKAFRLSEKNSGEREQVQCPCQRVLPDYSGTDKCKVFGRLSVIIRGVERLGGVWVFRTTSWNSVRSIMSSMLFIRQITGGILAGIPLVMSIHPKTAITPKGEIQTVYIVTLEFHGTMDELLQHSLKIRKTRLEYKVQTEVLEEQIRKRFASLPPVEFEEDERDIAEEFYPESVLSGDEDTRDAHPDRPKTQQEEQKEQQKEPQPEEKPEEKKASDGEKKKQQKKAAKQEKPETPDRAKQQKKDTTAEEPSDQALLTLW